MDESIAIRLHSRQKDKKIGLLLPDEKGMTLPILNLIGGVSSIKRRNSADKPLTHELFSATLAMLISCIGRCLFLIFSVKAYRE
jgi:hypothetical protein